MTPIRVLVVDDSAFVRRAVTRMLAPDVELAVVGEAASGQEALALAEQMNPDVITLDLGLPDVPGLEVLQQVMSRRPTPVVLLSSHAQADAEVTLAALAAGAIDFVDKATVAPMDVHRLAEELRRKVRAAALTARGKLQASPQPARALRRAGLPPVRLFVLGASTGGPPAIEGILRVLPASLPAALVVVQHMPAGFTTSFAGRLHGLGRLPVSEARHGERLEPGTVRVAPGGFDLGLRPRGDGIETVIVPAGVRRGPTIDRTLADAARCVGEACCAVILTGMGDDGRRGAEQLRAAGGLVLAQNARTSVVYGMPRAVVEAGLADQVVDLNEVPDLMMRLIR